MKSAAGKRPPDGENGPGKEAIRPRQLCLEESQKGGCTLARCSTSGSRDCADSKDDACDARHGARKVQIARCSASTSKNCKISFFTAPNSNIQLTFVKHFRIFALSFSKFRICFAIVVQNSPILMNIFWNFSNLTLYEKISKSLIFGDNLQNDF